MNIYRDPLIPKLFKHLSSIAVPNLNDIQMPSTFCLRQLIRCYNILTIRKCLIIPLYDFLSPCQKTIQFFHLATSQCALNIGNPIIKSQIQLLIKPRTIISCHQLFISCNPMATESYHFLIKFFIISNNHSTLTCCNWFYRVKTKCCHIRHASNLPAFIDRSQCMRTIFNNNQMMFLCNFMNLIHIAWLSGKVNCNNRFCSICNFSSDILWINIISSRINIRKNRSSATIQYTVRRSRKCKWCCNYFIPRLDSCCKTCRMKG